MSATDRWTTGLTLGLGLGMLGGLAEATAALLEAASPHHLGIFPAADVVLWGLLGGAAGLVAVLGRRWTASERREAVARTLLRCGLLLALLPVAAQMNLALPGRPWWLRPAASAGLLGVTGLLWLLAAPLARWRPLRRPLARLGRSWWLLVLVGCLGAAALTSLAGLGQEAGRAVPYQPPAAPQPGEGTGGAEAAGDPPRVMALGIDAGTWEMIGPLMERGEMPHLRGLMERGTWGVLESYPRSFSPVVWTSIMTGKSAAEHGVHTSAAERRVEAVWGIAKEAGLETAVLNVPGSYPVLGDADVMIAGFPLPARLNFDNLGWIATTGDAPAYEKSALPVELPVEPGRLGRGERTRVTIALRDLPLATRLHETVPLVMARAIGDDFANALLRRLAAVSFVRLELEIRRARDGRLRVRGGAHGELFDLAPGEWSGWLETVGAEGRASFRVHYVELPGDEVTLYVTPLFSAPRPDFVSPIDELLPLFDCPHVPEGSGWLLTYDERLVGSLHDHLLDIADCRLENGLAVLDRFTPDLFAYVFTVTDRMKHGLLKFAYPEAYRELAEELGGDYEIYRPTPELVRRHGGAVADSYRLVDAGLGRILERAGEDTWVVVMSDHGARPGPHGSRPTGGAHDPDGIYVVAPAPPAETGGAAAEEEGETPEGEGETAVPALPEERRGPRLVLEDIGPILLHLLGLPVGADMTGRVPPFVSAETGAVATIPSWEGEELGGAAAPEQDPALREQLKSLGYVD